MEVTQDFFSDNEALLAKPRPGARATTSSSPRTTWSRLCARATSSRSWTGPRSRTSTTSAKTSKASYDPNNDYSMPYQWGTTGILYNKKELGGITAGTYVGSGVQGRDRDDDRRQGDHGRGASGWATLNTTDSGSWKRPSSCSWSRSRPEGTSHRSSSTLVQNGDILLGHVYSGDGSGHRRQQGPGLCHPRRGRHPLDGQHGYTNGCRARRQRLQVHKLHPGREGRRIAHELHVLRLAQRGRPTHDRRILDDPRIYPPPEVFERLEVIEDIGKATRQYERIFTEVKSA